MNNKVEFIDSHAGGISHRSMNTWYLVVDFVNRGSYPSRILFSNRSFEHLTI
jgi:hypothetical protein